MAIVDRLLQTHAPAATLLIRVAVGAVFVSEGIGKFLYSAEQGAGRFAKIPGIPAPAVMGPFVGTIEIVCGTLVIIGLLTRLAVIPLLINISVAIATTKIPILMGHSYGLPKLAHYNFWGMLHEARTDLSMWLGLVFLLAVGSGPLSIDWVIGGWKNRHPAGGR